MASPNITADTALPTWRRFRIGVELGPGGEAHARVWAPRRRRVAFVLSSVSGLAGRATELEPEGNGYFSGLVPDVRDGTLYKLRLDDEGEWPDPASRYQPAGPHGPSEAIDPAAYRWRDAAWRGVSLAGQVLYEMHIGTFTREGTYLAAIPHLQEVADAGVTVLELLPLSEFAGRFGWGYDGVDLFAPHHHYGRPNDLRALVDAAHGVGLGVILDVVYNHLGPDGNYLKEFSDQYFKGQTEWGEALNFDGEQSLPVRELVVSNAAYWTSEFHFDGLRIDATQQIFDESSPHILAEVAASVRDAASGRATIVVAENEPQNATLVRSTDAGGYGLDGMWNDDFHHSALVAATGRDEAYYSGYRGNSQELISAAKYGFLHQGTWFEWQQGRRGSPAFDVPPFRFVHFTQNHDQVANSLRGQRLHQLVGPSRHRTVTALLLLLPQTPMLFQGQEFAATAPFCYFADHTPDLAAKVLRGRKEFLGQFVSIATSEATHQLIDPSDERLFEQCKLDWNERDRAHHAQTISLVRDALRLRREDDTFRRAAVAGCDGPAVLGRRIDGAVVNDAAFLLRYFGARPELDRVIAVNLGARVHATPFAEPLAAPPAASSWRPIWSSEHPEYGGFGTPSIDTDDGGWWLPAECLVVLAPVPRDRAGESLRHPSTEQEARAQWKSRYEKTAR